VSARYLLRFDDICPTMDHRKWSAIQEILTKHEIQPVLGVIPDNRDPGLMVDREDPGFWERIRGFQDRGWEIALHGFQHVCASSGKSLVPLHKQSEFAGLPLETQRGMLESAMRIMREQRLEPRVWIAPKHGLDGRTISALKSVGIRSISDGFAAYPYVEEAMLWIPQQMWRFRRMPFGVWTICLHPGAMREHDFKAMESFILANRQRFTTVSEIRAVYSDRCRSIADWAFEKVWFRLLDWKLRWV
jgi:predicted deacetylase